MHVPLPEGWTVRAVGGDIPDDLVGVAVPAAVPGCIHLDLLRAGLIPDPYLDLNEAAVAWVSRVDWRYETTLDWNGPPADAAVDDEQIDLVALGLDTVATVELNDTVLARTANMHRSYRFPVGDLLRPGPNRLAVTFAAGVTAAERMSEELGPRPHESVHPFNAIRKMASNYGWDWGPDLVTAGIWRPLELHRWTGARIASVRPLVDVDGTTGVVHTHVAVQRRGGGQGSLALHVEVGGVRARGEVPAGETSATVDVAVPDVALWWPHGYGEQPLYPVRVTLGDAASPTDRWQGDIGFRTVALKTEPDPDGRSFELHVNGRRIFARGANWIPDDCFPARIGRDRYAERLTQARDANINLVRVWGGGIYESEDFYGACDRLGVLVWQDFLFACAAYAEEEPLRGEVIAEAREAVTRLSPHPSLVLWNGGNENIWGHRAWGWQEPLGDRTWGLGYYTDLLPAIVAELDPSRPYSPGSPYSFSADRHPNDPAYGTVHIWDVWNQLDHTAYRTYRPRFVAEFGFQGPPTWATLTRSIHDDPPAADSPGMLAHQKAVDGNGKLTRGLRGHLADPTTFADWHWATSLNQARAVAYGVEHFRSLDPLCSGAVVWQLNDCWPVTSWAAVDGDGRRKPLWYALRRSYRDQLLTIQPRNGSLALVAVNDSSRPWSGTVDVSRRSFGGAVLGRVSVAIDLEPRARVAVDLPREITGAEHVGRELILADLEGNRAWWPFADDVYAALPPSSLRTELRPADGGYRLTVTSDALVRDVAVLADRLAPDAAVDDMLVTLLPGESATFRISTTATLTEAAVVDPGVLRCANQLRVGAGPHA